MNSIFNLSTRGHVLLSILIGLLMLPIVFFPLGVDQVFFLQGGEVIAHGGRMYVDYVDTKSPMIYYLFAGVYAVFGRSEIGVRSFELLWQLTTIAVLIVFLRRTFRNDIFAYSAAGIYALLYTLPGYALTLEGESLVAPLLVLLLWIQLSQKQTMALMVARGLVCALIIGCKYTFGIVIVAVLLYDVFSGTWSWRQLLRRSGASCLGLIAGLGVIFSPLIDSTTLAGFLEVGNFTKAYADIPRLSTDLIQVILKTTAEYFADKISLSVLGLIFVGVMVSDRKGLPETTANRLRSVQVMSILLGVVLLVSVVVERKCIFYHYSRLSVPMAISAGLGMMLVYQWLHLHWKALVFSRKVLIVLAFGTALVFSPFMRWLKYAPLPVKYALGGERYRAHLVSMSDPEYSPLTPGAIRDVLYTSDAPPSPTNRIFVMGLNANVVSYTLNQTPICKVNSTACYYGIGSPKAWKDEMWKEVKQAGWLVIEYTDRGYIINGHHRTTWESVQQDHELKDYLRANFDSTATIGGYYLYKRRK